MAARQAVPGLRHPVPALILSLVICSTDSKGTKDRRVTKRARRRYPMAQDEQAGDRSSITELLLHVRGGDPDAMSQLFPLVYETYLKMVDQPRVHWRDRAHFFRVASWAMRRILVDYARRHRALRRGGGVPPLSLDDEVAVAQQSDRLVALDEALE